MAKLNVFLAVAAVVLGLTSAITDDETSALKAAIAPVLQKCSEDFGISKEDLVAAKNTGKVDSLDPCLDACFLKQVGFINEAGHFDPDVALEKNKIYIKGADDLKTFAKIAKTCSAVNDQAVTDGAKGCDRSKLLLACLIKEKGTSFFPLATF